MAAWHVINGEWSLPHLDGDLTYLLPIEPLLRMARNKEPEELPFSKVCYREKVVSQERLRDCDTSYPCIVAENVYNPCGRKYRLIDGNHRIQKMINDGRSGGAFYVFQFDELKQLIKVFEEYLPDWPEQPNKRLTNSAKPRQ